jgi:CTP synthase (UTP-ammonia lyase)
MEASEIAAGLRIALIGDYNPKSETHAATYAGLHHAATEARTALEIRWIGTVDCEGRAASQLDGMHGVFVTTGSPYASLRGALDAIEFARVRDLPLLGTCGGFQHIVLEYARNVLGREHAMHAEYDAGASELFVSRLQCSLVGKTMQVLLTPNSRAHASYRAPSAQEQYYCNFGLNPDYIEALERGGLVISGHDQDRQPRIVELRDRRWFVGTLFVPQVNSWPERPHPLLVTFLRAVSKLANELAATRARA